MKTSKLTILHDDNSSFIDHTDDAFDYTRDEFALVMTTSEDALYIGYEKSINAVYVEMNGVNTTSADLTVEFYNGSAWTSVAGLYEDTKGFKRSGFIQWDRGQTDEAETTVNSVEQYWYKVTADATLSAGTELMGINLVLSDDNDLKEEWFEIMDLKPEGEDSYITKHVAARNEIIQKLRNEGKYKAATTATKEDINVFDLHRYDQLRQASKYLALSKICFNLMNEVDDLFHEKYREYTRLYDRAVSLFYLEIDTDDDGLLDASERMQPHRVEVVRL